MQVVFQDQRAVEVGGIVFKPVPVAGHVEGRGEIDMAVFQLVEHLGQDAEQFLVGHLVVESGAIGGVYLVPVYVFIGKEAVSLVENGP